MSKTSRKNHTTRQPLGRNNEPIEKLKLLEEVKDLKIFACPEGGFILDSEEGDNPTYTKEPGIYKVRRWRRRADAIEAVRCLIHAAFSFDAAVADDPAHKAAYTEIFQVAIFATKFLNEAGKNRNNFPDLAGLSAIK